MLNLENINTVRRASEKRRADRRPKLDYFLDLFSIYFFCILLASATQILKDNIFHIFQHLLLASGSSLMTQWLNSSTLTSPDSGDLGASLTNSRLEDPNWASLFNSDLRWILWIATWFLATHLWSSQCGHWATNCIWRWQYTLRRSPWRSLAQGPWGCPMVIYNW